MEEFEESNAQISKYNDAGYSISRLNEHWIQAERYANAGLLTKWKFKLDSLWRELFPDLMRIKATDDKKCGKLIIKNTKLMISIAKAKKQNELYFYLNKRHEFLRELQDLAGKAGVYVDENDEGFE